MGRELLDNRWLAFPFPVTSEISQEMEKQLHLYSKLGKVSIIQMLEFLLNTGHMGLFNEG